MERTFPSDIFHINNNIFSVKEPSCQKGYCKDFVGGRIPFTFCYAGEFTFENSLCIVGRVIY